MSQQSDAFVPATHDQEETADLDDVELDRAMTAVSPDPASAIDEPSRTSQQQQQQEEARIAVSMEPEDPSTHRSALPFGAHAAHEPAIDGAAASASASSSSATDVPRMPDGRPHTHSTDAILRAQHIGRTPPPPYPEYQVLGQQKAVGFVGKTVWAGLKVFGAMEFVGEVFADFFGLYDSKYQCQTRDEDKRGETPGMSTFDVCADSWCPACHLCCVLSDVIDAHDRHRRELEAERAERAALRREHRQEQAAAAHQATAAAEQANPSAV